jgi:alkanesulfonate monooxygenase SsuD/methylene tetrahydromethanopterin reductase-like flavin-dependent oxidoreductase (luciferase family)
MRIMGMATVASRLAWLAAHARFAVRWVSDHTGMPALLVAAVLLVLGYRVLQRSARFALQVLVVLAVLLVATQMGWLRF